MNTFCKLPTGAWGIKSTSQLAAGQQVEVSLKSGGTKVVKIADFIEWKNQAAFYTIAQEPKAEAPKVAVGDLAAINALFDKARAHLTAPRVTLNGFRVSVAGPHSKAPGTLSIVSAKANAEGSRDWYGRVEKDGTFKPSQKCPAEIADRLREFAANPPAVAARWGKLNGKCCFCGIKLGAKDKSKAPSATALKSLAVGYGKDCAEHFGLPWGEVIDTTFAA